MVGRAELLTPARQNNLRDALTRANNGDAQAARAAEAQLKQLGRFAEPALTLLMKDAPATDTQKAWALLQNTRASHRQTLWE